jgi:hypothetical protein
MELVEQPYNRFRDRNGYQTFSDACRSVASKMPGREFGDEMLFQPRRESIKRQDLLLPGLIERKSFGQGLPN